MKKEFKKYMRLGKKISVNKVNYILIEDMKEDSDYVMAVKEENKRRYDLLRAWSRNDVGLKEEDKKEFENLPERIHIPDCTPVNTIRFIDSHYNTLFKVRDFDYILAAGKVYMAVYIDETHVYLIDKKGYANVFHICEFAEFCERNQIKVESDNWEEVQKSFSEISQLSSIPGKEFRRVREGDIIDEDKSVKWNKEEVIRLQAAYKEEMLRLRKIINKEYNFAVDRALSLISQDTGLTYEKSGILWSFVYAKYHSSMNDIFINMDEYISLVNDLLA